MGMQIHFNVLDIPDTCKIYKHADYVKDEDHPEDAYTDYYIVIDPNSIMINTCPKYELAWFDCGYMSDNAMKQIRWLIANRIPFRAS